MLLVKLEKKSMNALDVLQSSL